MNAIEFSLLIGTASLLAGFLGSLTGLGGGVVIVPVLALASPRDPDLISTLECDLVRVLNLTMSDLYDDLGHNRRGVGEFNFATIHSECVQETDAYTATRHSLLS
jgi:hypothetical protein